MSDSHEPWIKAWDQEFLDRTKVTVTDEAPRCWRCHRKLAERASRPWVVVCGKCKATNASVPD